MLIMFLFLKTLSDDLYRFFCIGFVWRTRLVACHFLHMLHAKPNSTIQVSYSAMQLMSI